MRLDFYTKANCPLCDEARDVLEPRARRAMVAFQEHDILADERLFALYRYRIPVLTVDGVEVLYAHFPPTAVERLLGLRPPVRVALIGVADDRLAAALSAAGYVVGPLDTAQVAVVGPGARVPRGVATVPAGDPPDVVAALAYARTSPMQE